MISPQRNLQAYSGHSPCIGMSRLQFAASVDEVLDFLKLLLAIKHQQNHLNLVDVQEVGRVAADLRSRFGSVGDFRIQQLQQLSHVYDHAM